MRTSPTASTARSTSSTTLRSTPTGRARETDGVSGGDTSYRAQLNFPGDRYGVQLERLRVGEQFNPEVGFVRRTDIRRTLAEFRFSPRPAFHPSIRRLVLVDRLGGLLRERRRPDGCPRSSGGVRDRVPERRPRRGDVHQTRTSSSPSPSGLRPGSSIPVAGYDWQNVRLSFNSRPQRRRRRQPGLRARHLLRR